KVRTYGFKTPGGVEMMGLSEWSYFAVSDGFKFQDKPWSNKYYYDDPKLVETISYLAGLPDKGLSAPYEQSKSLGPDAMFVGGKVAMIPSGSWMISYFKDNAKMPNAWVPLPKGPDGKRATMFNGLADSIWVGSKVQDEAWKWVKYLGSADCQSVVAAKGVVFPAIKGMADKVMETQKTAGVDSSAFITMSKEHTFLAPIGDNGSEIDSLMKTAFESIYIGKADAAATLKEVNAKVNALGN
ncbi:MAG TPA: extracellular solute-binding protein, partial [Thiolinea sp.]|nr:extracellular solute-binding protein [Thiolinea sp.]